MSEPKEFWNSLIVEKSWRILQELKKLPIKFMVIGGWAVWLWAKQQKSKGIDVIIADFSDLEYLKKHYDLRKNDNLKKYEIKVEGIDIDIYVPYFSDIAIPIGEIQKHTTRIMGFSLPNPEILLVLKQQAEIARQHSAKGEKDRIDILTLIDKIDFKKYKKIIGKYKKEESPKRLKDIIKNFKDFDRLNLTPRELKMMKKKTLERIKGAGL